MAKQREGNWLTVVMVLVAIYIIVAFSTFALRHPWATKTEQFLYTFRALSFGTVDYDEARPREAGK